MKTATTAADYSMA